MIVDEVDEEGAVGRSQWDAPEIDGSVFLEGATDLKPGDIVRAKVTRADDYDLWAEPVCGGGDVSTSRSRNAGADSSGRS